MYLSIATTHKPAIDLSYLLHKHPDRLQTFNLSFGKAHVFYPEAKEDLCTCVLLLDIDPVGLVRGRGRSSRTLFDYVNDRPYVASSFMSVAIAKVFGTALNGRCKERPKLVDASIPLEVRLSVLPCRGGEQLLRRLFEPLNYNVEAEHHVLDPRFPDWGMSRYFTVTLSAEVKLSDLLTHLYVLIPVLDDDKHYYVGGDEIEKLLRRGEGWLAEHPEHKLITDRYLTHRRSLTRQALKQLLGEESFSEDEEARKDREEALIEKPISLNEQRLGTVLSVLKGSVASRILDLGCGEGNLMRELLNDSQFREVAGVDVSHVALRKASRRLKLDRMPARKKERVHLIQGSLTYRDDRLKGYDAAALVEVIEHIDLDRMVSLERSVFEFSKPQTVVVTTPNTEYNVRFENLPEGRKRHRDHRFEWTRAEFQAWSRDVAKRNGYSVRYLPVGQVDPEVGPPTQMAVFTLTTGSDSQHEGREYG